MLKELKTSLPQPKYGTSPHSDSALPHRCAQAALSARRLLRECISCAPHRPGRPPRAARLHGVHLGGQEVCRYAQYVAGGGFVCSLIAQVRTTTTSTRTKSWWRWACLISSVHSSTPSPRALHLRALRSTTKLARARLCATHSPPFFVVRASRPSYTRSQSPAALSILFLTRLLYYTPYACLGAIVITAAVHRTRSLVSTTPNNYCK